MAQNQRKAPFTGFEREYLRELISEYSDIIESKKTDAIYNKKKNVVWLQITNKFNSSPRCQEATMPQLKKLWNNLKARARDAKSLEKQRHHTGGGAYIKDMDTEDENVLSIIPNILPTVKVIRDSDGDADLEADDDTLYWQPKSARVNLPPTFLPPKSLDSDSIIISIPTTTCTETSVSQNDVTTIAATPAIITNTIASTNTSTTPKNSTTRPAAVTNTTRSCPNLNTIDKLKLDLIQKDIDYRQVKYTQEIKHQERMNNLQFEILQKENEHKNSMIEHQNRINDLQYQMLQRESEHKNLLYKLIEAEHKTK